METKFKISIIFLIIGTVIGSIILGLYVDEISNNVTLLVEVGVGISIAVSIYGITKENEKKIEKQINSISDIVKDREEFRKEQEVHIKKTLLNGFTNIYYSVEEMLFYAELFEEENDVLIQKEFNKKQVILESKKITEQAKMLIDDQLTILYQFFDMDKVDKFRTLSFLCKTQPDFNKNGKNVDVKFCTEIKNMIHPWIEEFRISTYELKEKSAFASPLLLEDLKNDLRISVSSDRTVYPLNSIIHARTNIETLIPNEKIIFQLFNSKKKLVHTAELDPEKFDNLELKEAGLFETSFIMEGDDWKVGESYFLRATYHNSTAQDSFTIDERMPVVQTDKSVYIIGSDMILTVIDPDADKDNQKAEYVGDREDSKLIIESPYGKIENYRLLETGDSTGIFQGILGIIGIHGDGTVIRRNVDGKIIDSIQGKEIQDGFIGGSPGDQIRITYKNKKGTASLIAFISNFGATVELDSRIYKAEQKVYITVVAPDFNFNSATIDEIGQSSESEITIQTSIDKLSNFKLIETNSDSGIFTGEVILTEKKEKSSSKHKDKFGSTDEYIACNRDDVIEVILNYFGRDKIIGRALIQT